MPENIHKQHRERVKSRFLAEGMDHMPPHNALELVLFYAIPQGDVNGLAHRLIERFGSYSAVIDAPYSICWDEAENRKHSIRGLLAYFCPDVARDDAAADKARARVNDLLEKIGKTPAA